MDSDDTDVEFTSDEDELILPEEDSNHKPRDYQLELFEHAKVCNSIIVLGTGSGKTFIASLLIKHFADQIKGKVCDGAKRTFMIANTVLLVLQQAKAIKQHTSYSVASYDGSMNVDFYDKEKWAVELEKSEVLVMTSQILRNMLYHGYINITQINLLIIDECHHAIGNHPMNDIMNYYSLIKKDGGECPRILGLTASIIQCKCKDDEVDKKLKMLESTLHSRLVTSVDYKEVRKYTTKPKEKFEPFNNGCYSPLSEHAQRLMSVLEVMGKEINEGSTDKKCIKSCSRVIRNIGLAIEDLGEWCGSRAIEFELDYFEELGNEDVLQFLNAKLEEMLQMCKSKEKTFANSKQHVSHHVLTLLKVLKTALNNNCDLAALVFVKTRFSAFLLTALLEDLRLSNPEEFQFGASKCIVGVNTNPWGDMAKSRKSIKEQAKVLEGFRRGDFQILICTSVLEEGVDVRKCNLVVHFDEPSNFRSYVQSKGRARAEESTYVMLLGPDTNLHSEIESYRKLEQKIQHVCHDRALPSEEDIEEVFSDYKLAPYAPYGVRGPMINSNSCLTVLNNYCIRLPHDRFTLLAPTMEVRQVSNTPRFVAELSLPISAPYHSTVRSDIMGNRDLAKRSAALKLCKILHVQKELNENLLPHAKTVLDEELLEPIIGDISCDVKNAKNVGTKKRKQVHEKEICTAFSTNDEGKCYLYSVNIEHVKKTFNASEFDGDRNMGILVLRELHTCSFPLYNQKWGEVKVSLQLVNSCEFTMSLLSQLQHFHKLVFQFLLNINSSVLTFLQNDSKSKVLIVPLLHGSIDIAMLSNISSIPSLDPKIPDEDLRKNFIFDSSAYDSAIVIPWYKAREVFSVIRVTQKVPGSPFPMNKKNWASFNEYANDVYKLKVYNQSQNLLECRHISSELNCLNPITFQTRKTLDESHPVLVPELCYLLPIPGRLYQHITCLPSVLHFLNAINITADFLTNLNFLPVVTPSELVINPNWSYEFTHDIIKSSTSRNVCVAMQENDSINFNDYNLLLHHYGFEPEVERNYTTASQTSRTLSLSPAHLLQALIPSQSSPQYNLERCEVLGDSFLKYHIAQILFLKYPDWHEGKLTSNRSVFVSNKTLYLLGRRLRLPEKLQATRLCPVESGPAPGFVVPDDVKERLENDLHLEAKLWHKYDPNTTKNSKDVAGASKDETSSILSYDPWHMQKVPDKMVADSVEALLGATLLYAGLTAGHRLMMALNFDVGGIVKVPSTAVVIRDSDLSQEALTEKLNKINKNVLSLYDKYRLDRLENIIKYKFNEKSFLLQAVTHPSFTYNTVTHFYQRLEYLGDAVLDFLVTGHVFATPNLSPGRITDVRCHFVRNDTLARACVRSGVHRYLQHMCPKLQAVIDRFIGLVQQEECLDSDSSGDEGNDGEEDITLPSKRRYSVNNASDKRTKVEENLAELSLRHDREIDFGISKQRLLKLSSFLYPNFHMPASSTSEESEAAVSQFLSRNEVIVCKKCSLNTESETSFLERVDVPKILGDLIEAIIGAVYLDSNLSLHKCWDVIQVLLPELVNDKEFQTVRIDCVRLLYEKNLIKKLKKIPPSEMNEMAVVKIKVAGLPWLTGKASNLRAAKQAVARLALERLYGKNWHEKIQQ